ncbi:MAG: hypothetical protein AB1730_27865 [Myxococcota bacterium]|jgi:hypothetical protein
MWRAWWWLSVGSLLLAACATTPPPPAGDEQPLPREAAVPAPKDDDLAQAWAPVEAKPVAEPSAASRVEPLPEPPDRRGPFRDAMAEAQRALHDKELDAAKAAADRACAEAADLASDERTKAWALAFKVSLAMKDAEAATETALAWRRACGPDGVDTCRAQVFRALGQVAKLKGANAAALKALAKSLQEADTCVAQAERAANAPPCLSAAEKTAHKHRDELLSAQVLYAKALAEKNEAKRPALFAKAEARCQSPWCAGLRRKALAKQQALALAANDLEGAVKLAMRDLAVATSLVEPGLRLWVRPPELDRLCAKYDAARGAGACRRVEKDVTGQWTFRDFSKDRPSEALSPDQVKAVNEHYAPLLEECLSEQAQRLTPPDAQRFQVSWTVQNDGRVREAHLRRDLDDTLLARCLRRQFSAWRYPRFTGELQHVEQSFLVSAVERRR